MGTTKRTFLELYALAVCFINVLIGSIAVGVIFYGVVSVASPELTLSAWQYSNYQSNDNFIASRADTDNLINKFESMSEQEINHKRNQAYRIVLAAERRKGLQNIVQFLIVLLIQIVLFIIHWKLAKRKRQ